jgi:hypothetical protein
MRACNRGGDSQQSRARGDRGRRTIAEHFGVKAPLGTNRQNFAVPATIETEEFLAESPLTRLVCGISFRVNDGRETPMGSGQRKQSCERFCLKILKFGANYYIRKHTGSSPLTFGSGGRPAGR